jgi:hypothetical protein
VAEPELHYDRFLIEQVVRPVVNLYVLREGERERIGPDALQNR